MTSVPTRSSSVSKTGSASLPQREVPSIAWIHPHVQGGRPCLGNVRVGVEKYIGLGEMAAAAQLVLAFLSTYDPAHAYCPITRWPRVDAQSGTDDASA
jgi:hypothetical protein